MRKLFYSLALLGMLFCSCSKEDDPTDRGMATAPSTLWYSSHMLSTRDLTSIVIANPLSGTHFTTFFFVGETKLYPLYYGNLASLQQDADSTLYFFQSFHAQRSGMVANVFIAGNTEGMPDSYIKLLHLSSNFHITAVSENNDTLTTMPTGSNLLDCSWNSITPAAFKYSSYDYYFSDDAISYFEFNYGKYETSSKSGTGFVFVPASSQYDPNLIYVDYDGDGNYTDVIFAIEFNDIYTPHP